MISTQEIILIIIVTFILGLFAGLILSDFIDTLIRKRIDKKN